MEPFIYTTSIKRHNANKYHAKKLYLQILYEKLLRMLKKVTVIQSYQTYKPIYTSFWTFLRLFNEDMKEMVFESLHASVREMAGKYKVSSDSNHLILVDILIVNASLLHSYLYDGIFFKNRTKNRSI